MAVWTVSLEAFVLVQTAGADGAITAGEGAAWEEWFLGGSIVRLRAGGAGIGGHGGGQ